MKPDDSSVEVEGIRFQTVMAEPVLVMPLNHSDSTPAQFRLQITNLSSHPYYFTFFGLIPEIKGLNGQQLHSEHGRNATRSLSPDDFLLAEPGATVSGGVAAKLNWHRAQLRLIGLESSGGVWQVRGLEPGAYEVRFTYKGPSVERPTSRRRAVLVELEPLWKEVMSTPFVRFDIAMNLPKS